MTLDSKLVQMNSKIVILLRWSKTMTHSNPALLVNAFWHICTWKKPLNFLLQKLFIQWVSRIWASLTWLQSVTCRLQQIFSTAPAASKNDGHFKSGQNWLKKIISLRYSSHIQHNLVISIETNLEAMSDLIMQILLLISSWIKCSMLSFPNPKSLRCRSVNRRCSCQLESLANITPRVASCSSF